MPSLNLGFGIWLLPLVGLIFAGIIIWQGRRFSRSNRKLKGELDNLLKTGKRMLSKKRLDMATVETWEAKIGRLLYRNNKGLEKSFLNNYGTLQPFTPKSLLEHRISKLTNIIYRL